MFKQKIEDGFQMEVPDDWLKEGNPFEMKRPEYAVEVRFGGYVTVRKDEASGRDRFVQEDYQSVKAVPYDLPVVGYGNRIVNTLRIWDAEAMDTFNLDSFDKGDYQKAVSERQSLRRQGAALKTAVLFCIGQYSARGSQIHGDTFRYSRTAG